MKFFLTFFFLFLSTSVFANECISGDCVNGYGTYVWDNGDKYVGEWKNNLFEGQGTYTFANGTAQKGIWKNGELVTPN